MEEIISRNPSSSGEELMAMNRLGQLVLETSRHLKAIRRENYFRDLPARAVKRFT